MNNNPAEDNEIVLLVNSRFIIDQGSWAKQNWGQANSMRAVTAPAFAWLNSTWLSRPPHEFRTEKRILSCILRDGSRVCVNCAKLGLLQERPREKIELQLVSLREVQ